MSSPTLSVPASPLASPSRAHITQHSAYKGAQAASLIVPPAYILYSLTKSTFSINHLLRATALGVGVLGPAVGAAMAVGKMGGMGEGEVVEKDGRLRGSVSSACLQLRRRGEGRGREVLRPDGERAADPSRSIVLLCCDVCSQVTQTRVNDYSTIGAVVGALVTTVCASSPPSAPLPLAPRRAPSDYSPFELSSRCLPSRHIVLLLLIFCPLVVDLLQVRSHAVRSPRRSRPWNRWWCTHVCFPHHPFSGPHHQHGRS